MADFSRALKIRSLKSSWVLLIPMLFLGMATVILIQLLRYSHEYKSGRSIVAPIRFNPDSCVRLHDLTRLYAIKADPLDPNRIWFCGAEGIRVLDQVTLEWRRFGLDHGLPAEGITSIAFSDSFIWAGTSYGLAKLGRSASRFSPVSIDSGSDHSQIWSLEWVPGHGLYVSAAGKGLFNIDKRDSSMRVPVQGIDTKMNITCLRLLSGNRLFIGTEGSIALVMDLHSGKVSRCFFERPVEPSTILWDILENQGAVYIATSNDGIWTAPRLTDTLRQLKSNPAKGAYAFAADSDGIWAGTPYGLWRYFPQNDAWLQMVNPEEREPTDFQVQCLYNTREQLWYGSAALGAGFFDKEKVAWHRFKAGLSRPNIAALAASDSILWTGYGYQGGMLDLFTGSDIQYERNYGINDGITDANMQSLLLEGARLYYGGFASFGYIDLQSGKKRHFEEEDGLRSPDIAAIAPFASNHLLLAGCYGMVDFNCQSETFSVMEPTKSQRITCFLDCKDSIWYGTLGQGLFVYNRKANATAGKGLHTATRIAGIDLVDDNASQLFAATKEDGCYLIDMATGAIAGISPPVGILRGSFKDSPNNIMALRRMGSRLWLATREAGCLIFDNTSGAWFSLTMDNGLVSNQVRSLCESEKYIWVGCYGGVTRFDKAYLERAQFSRAQPSSADKKTKG